MAHTTMTQIESLIEQMMEEKGVPGFALGIVVEGQPFYINGFGVETVGNDKPVTIHSVFGTGSIGKTAVAVAIMQLAIEGKLALDEPVTTYLPYFTLSDARYRKITVRHLVSHRSGMPDTMDWNAVFAKAAEYDDGVLERYVRSLSSLELLFAPGEQWSYSGIGYNLLGDVVTKVSGQTLESYLQKHIIEPLHMDDTILIIKEEDKKRLANPHMRMKKGVVFVNDGFLFPYRRELAPSGPLYSSITDMTRFAAMCLSRGELAGTRILPAASYDEMWAPVSTVDWDFGPSTKPLFAAYGTGFFIGNLDGRRIVHHIGLDFGYSAAMLLAPDDGIAVVTISNYFDWKKWDLFAVESAIEVMRLLYV